MAQQRESQPALAFDCYGRITVVVFENGRIKFPLVHAFCHEVRQLCEVTEAVKKFIEDHRDLPSAALVTHQLRLEQSKFPEMKHIKPDQIYYHWSQIQTDRYKRHENPLASALLMMEEQGTNIICRGNACYDCIGILTPIFDLVMGAAGRETEFSFDSTCKFLAY